MKRETKKILAEIILIVLVCSYNKMFIFALIWVFLHEITHILVALKFGCKFYNIEFHIFGMKAELIDIDSLKENQKIIVYLSGALLNIVLAIFFYIINIKYDSSFIETSMNLNIGLAVFNLLPAYPLDGSRILEVILSKKMLFKKAQKIISIVSFSIAALFIIISAIIYIFLHSLNLSMIIGAIIIIYITRMEEHTTMYITMSNVVKKRNPYQYITSRDLLMY